MLKKNISKIRELSVDHKHLSDEEFKQRVAEALNCLLSEVFDVKAALGGHDEV